MNSRVEKIQISGIRRFSEKVKKVDGAVSLTIGQPDFDVPRAVAEGMIKAVNDGKTTYTSNAGLDELRDEICEYLKSFVLIMKKKKSVLQLEEVKVYFQYYLHL